MSNNEHPPSQSFASKTYSLLIGLYHNHPTRARDNALNPIHYHELNKFRQEIEDNKSGPHHRPFETEKKRSLIYRLIFIGLGFIFFILSLMVYGHTVNWSYSFLFENCMVPKFFICSLCLILSITAFGIGFAIRPEREAAARLVRRGQLKLKRIYNKKLAEIDAKNSEQAHILRQIYLDFLDKILDSKMVTLLLLTEIANKDKTIEPADLFNQAILELNDALHLLIQQFNKKLTEIY